VVVTNPKYLWRTLSLSLIFISQKLLAFGPTKLKFLTNYFTQESTSGRQVYDESGVEDADVWEPMLFIDTEITEKTSVNAMFVFDTWTAASDTRLDANTGASGGGIERQARFAGKIGGKTEIDKTTYSGNFGVSTEFDYRSVNLSLGAERSFAQDNFTLFAGVQFYNDLVKLYDIPTNVYLPWNDKYVYAFDLKGSQLLTRSDILQFGYSYIWQQGALEGIANTIRVGGTRIQEKLPNDRNRHALSTKWVHGFSDFIALHLAYRYYFDNWDISGHTIKPSLAFSMFEDKGLLELSYRFYNQSATKYYDYEFASAREFMTSDSDLSKFNSSQFGVHYSYLFEDSKWWKLNDFELTTAVYHYHRSTGLDYQIAQVGIGAQF